jgi:heme-degrading monooxygenase HmoA
MYARVARYEVEEQRMDEAVDAFREAASKLAGLEGLQGGYVLTDAEDGVVISITLWENRATMDASEVRAARLRQEAAKQADGAVTSVQCLEVAVNIGENS